MLIGENIKGKIAEEELAYGACIVLSKLLMDHVTASRTPDTLAIQLSHPYSVPAHPFPSPVPPLLYVFLLFHPIHLRNTPLVSRIRPLFPSFSCHAHILWPI